MKFSQWAWQPGPKALPIDIANRLMSQSSEFIRQLNLTDWALEALGWSPGSVSWLVSHYNNLAKDLYDCILNEDMDGDFIQVRQFLEQSTADPFLIAAVNHAHESYAPGRRYTSFCLESQFITNPLNKVLHNCSFHHLDILTLRYRKRC
ncbi:hypothetical protein BDW74DRAFT_116151 [Aspergillus multicolor]|uniref:uncharacterized protein n=1 Tax=Aspergillus multicolor TaxID=41759 RepID=UPI003CCCD94D